MSDEKKWCDITLCIGTTVTHYEFSKAEVTIGRSKDCDISIQNNHVSSNHCRLIRFNSVVTFRDESTNGSLINMKHKLSKSEEIELVDGDIVHLVFKRGDANSHVYFKLALDLSSDLLNSTLEYDADDIQPESPAKKQRIKENDVAKTDDSDEDMVHTLTCMICQELLHDAVSVQPCLHTFCGGCYSGWMVKSDECPTCRGTVTRISKNHLIANLIDVYIRAHPSKKRDPEVLAELDEKNKIKTGDIDQPEIDENINESDNEEGSSSEGESANTEDELHHGDDDDDDGGNNILIPQIAIIRCRQCYNFNDRGEYQCPHPMEHILCQCCNTFMPDRRNEDNIIQNCGGCNRNFCSMYFGDCTGCRGRQPCVTRFEDYSLLPHDMNAILNQGNPFESDILMRILQSKDISLPAFARILMQKFSNNVYSITNDEIFTYSYICRECFIGFCGQLAYQYRKEVDDDDNLPLIAKSRPSCWYGKNCRTQRHNALHAQKYNHICEQIRN